MQDRFAGSLSARRRQIVLAGAALLILLAPWWRNHAYLRDFYDYGLVMAGVARIEHGEHPYVDFVTPIQTGTFLFNGWFERMGAGTYQAMTHGAVVVAILGVGLLYGMFLRRWKVWVAAGVAGALGGATLVQHTLIWHNSLGALCIALAAGGAAIAPALRRSQWGWHFLVGGALFVGGINKINSQLIAVCVVFAWALRAGFSQRAEWWRVGGTFGLVVVCGLILPFGCELAWTGASPAQWWYNVVALPIGSRSGDLAAALHWKFYLSPRHDYYGPLLLPPLGALGLIVTAAFAVTAVRSLHGSQRGWALAAALFAAGAGIGLLATNYEIAYVAMGAWFALIASLWLGFELDDRSRAFHAGFLAPVLLVGAVAGWSAWQGQRSQFGYSQAPRSDYVAGESAGTDFAYLRGTFVPPEIGSAMSVAAAWRQTLSPEARAAVFYGPGLEWLERPWPALKIPGLPLWMHGGTSYGPAEERKLLRAISSRGPYRYLLVPEARDHWEWDPPLAEELAGKYARQPFGGAWRIYQKLPDAVSWRPLDFLRAFGGNVNPRYLSSDTMQPHALDDGRMLLGTDQGRGELRLVRPSNRAEGDAVVRWLPGRAGGGGAAAVHFEVFSLAGGNRYPRWAQDVTLAPGEREQVIHFPLDCGGAPLLFVVTVPSAAAGRVVAGWRGLRILHTLDETASPGQLQAVVGEARTATADLRAALLPAGWNPEEIYVRDGRVENNELVVRPGGEVWLRLSGLFREIRGTATMRRLKESAESSVVRIAFVKGPQLDVQSQAALNDRERRFEFKAWSTETDGWLVLAVDPSATAASVAFQLTSAVSAQ